MGAPRYRQNQARDSLKMRKWKSIAPEDKKITEVTTEEVICKHCGFKTRYKFVRCPNCEKLQ